MRNERHGGLEISPAKLHLLSHEKSGISFPFSGSLVLAQQREWGLNSVIYPCWLWSIKKKTKKEFLEKDSKQTLIWEAFQICHRNLQKVWSGGLGNFERSKKLRWKFTSACCLAPYDNNICEYKGRSPSLSQPPEVVNRVFSYNKHYS